MVRHLKSEWRISAAAGASLLDDPEHPLILHLQGLGRIDEKRLAF